MEETAVIQQSSWFQDAMKKGLILGVIHIVLFLVIYVAFPSKLTGFSYLFIILAVNLGYTIFQGIQWRKSVGGYVSYGAAFKYAFVVLLFNGLLGTVFTMIFLLIDPAFPDQMAQSQLDTSIYWAQKFGAPDDAVEQIRDKYNPEDVTKRFTPVGMLTGFGIALLFYGLGALIIALFVRKREPEMI